jgi:pyruvate-formate lyase
MTITEKLKYDQLAQKLNAERIIKVVQIQDNHDSNAMMPVKVKIDPRVKICLERALLVTRSYKRTEGEPWIIRRAKAIDYLLRNMTIYINEGELIVGNYASNEYSLPTYPEISSRWLVKGLTDEFKDTLDEKGKEQLKKIHEYWKDRNVESAILEATPKSLEDFINSNLATCNMTRFWPLGFMAPDLRNWVFPLGIEGILERIYNLRKKIKPKDSDHEEKMNFYDAAEICGKAVIAFANRYADLAKSKAEDVESPAKAIYLKIATVCKRVPQYPPRTLHEAMQAFYFCHLITAQITWYSVGIQQRFDYLFYPFYKNEKNAGKITYKEAVELFEHLWIKLDDLGQINPISTSIYQAGGTKFQNAAIGGVDDEGNDATNELSFAMIDATMKIRTAQPSLSLFYHEKINPELVEKSIDCISTGIGMPAIFNNDVIMKWHLEQAITRIYPEEAGYFGVPILGVIQTLQNSKILKKISKVFLSLLPKKFRNVILKSTENWPYKLCTSNKRIVKIIRNFLQRSCMFDSKRVMSIIRNWSLTSCVGGGFSGQVIVQGTLSTVLIFTVLNFVKCLEYVMYQGFDPISRRQASIKTPDPRTFKSYEEFLDAFLMQIKYQMEKTVKAHAIVEPLYGQMIPRPLASMFCKTPVYRGIDATRRGDGAINEVFSMGSINVGDSLAVIKKLVFEEKQISMDELIKACSSNWNAYSDIYRKCLAVPKFGNDDDFVDNVIADMYEKVHQTVHSIKDHYGMPIQLESSLAAGYYVGGLLCGATPDGRKRFETVSDGQLSPMHGRDLLGPTAVLKSCSKVDPLKSWNQLCNQKFNPLFLKGKYKKVFADYLKTWYHFNNWHIQFNCVNADDLKDAMIHPEKHRDLIVRVAGYSAFFIDLAKGLQEDIIKRTEQALGKFNSMCSSH